MKNTRIIINLAVISLAAVIFSSILFFYLRSAPPPAPPAADIEAAGKAFHVGLLAPMTGDSALFGPSMQLGAKAAEVAINQKGGILGKQVRLHVADTKSEPETAVEAAKNLVKMSKVNLLLGTVLDEETLAVARFAEEKRIPFIYLMNGEPKTCRKNDPRSPSDVLWGAGLTKEMKMEPLLIFLAERIPEEQRSAKFSYFVIDTPLAVASADRVQQAAESLGFTTITREVMDERLHDYYQEIRRITAQQTDVFFLFSSKRNLSLVVSQLSKLNSRAVMTIAGLDLFEEERLAAFGKAADGFYTVADYSHTLDSPINKKFLEEWKKLYPEARHPTAVAASAYSSMLLAQNALNKAGSAEPERFAEGMRDLDLELPQGRVTVNFRNHLFNHPLYSVKLKDGFYEAEQYLGDVSHPVLDGCVGTPNLEERKNAAQPEPTESEEE